MKTLAELSIVIVAWTPIVLVILVLWIVYKIVAVVAKAKQ